MLRENCLSDNKHVNKHLGKISTVARLDFFGGEGGGGSGGNHERRRRELLGGPGGMLPRKILNYRVSEIAFQPSESINFQQFFFVEAINK